MAIAGVSARTGTFAIAVQTAKGTAAATMTNKFYFNGAPSIKPVRTEGRYSMTDSSRFAQGDPFVSGISVAGQVPLYAHPDLMGYLFYLALGTNVESGAAPPYIHTVTAGATLPYFTAWKFMAGGIVEKYVDCQINSLQITSGGAGQPLSVVLDIIGISSTFLAADVTTVDPSVSTPLNFADGSGALKVDTVAYPIHAFDMTINNNLVGFQADGYTFDAIDPQGLDISGSYSIRFSGSTALPLDYRKYFYSTTQTGAGSDSGTVQTIAVGTHALDFKWSGPTANQSLQIQIPVARWADLPINPDPSGNVIEVQCAFEVQRAGFTTHVENTPITVVASDTSGAITAS